MKHIALRDIKDNFNKLSLICLILIIKIKLIINGIIKTLKSGKLNFNSENIVTGKLYRCPNKGLI